MARIPQPQIQRLLDAAYADFHSHYYREKDPVCLAHRYANPRDREVSAFFAAILAYGNVQTILGSVNRILSRLGDSPYETLIEKRFSGLFDDFRHRFTAGIDIEIVCHWLSEVLHEYQSIEKFFLAEANPKWGVKEHLTSFVTRIEKAPLPPRLRRERQLRERSLKYLLSDPERGSACKRLNMYLRWMVRPNDGIDLGLWKGIRQSQLMLPVDTHLLQTLQALRWTRSKQATWRVVEEATARLRLYSPEDPVRYDFALCHLSMAGKNIRHYLRDADEKAPQLE